MTSMEQASGRPADQSPEERSTRGVWVKDRAFGLLALALAAAGQVAVLLAILFAPEDDPNSVLDTLETHWTDGLGGWWLGLSGVAGLVALLGLVADKHRDMAATALGAAFIGFIWPWGT
jgi:hypothetical protein